MLFFKELYKNNKSFKYVVYVSAVVAAFFVGKLIADSIFPLLGFYR